MKNNFISRTGSFLTDNFYLLFVIFAFLSFRFNFPGVIRSILWVLVALFSCKKIKTSGTVNGLVVFYVLCGLLSFIGFLLHPYPIEFYFIVLFESYIPIIFYFIGYDEKNQFPVFYQRCVYAFSFVFIIGIFWLITNPAWYVEKQLQILNMHGYYTEDTLMYARFASFLDSYHTGNFGVFLLCISLGGLYYMNDKRFNKILYTSTAFLAFISVLLSQQRVAMYTSILIIAIFVIFLNKNKSQKTLFLILIIAIPALLYISTLDVSNYVSLDSITERFSRRSSSTLVSGRSASWKYALENQRNFIFGHGVGGGGHLAHSNGITPAVRDGSYFKILLETGIFSLLTFLIILFTSLKKGFKNMNKYLVETLILLFCILSLFGANIIDFPYIIAIMWYVLGRLSNNKPYYIYNEQSK